MQFVSILGHISNVFGCLFYGMQNHIQARGMQFISQCVCYLANTSAIHDIKQAQKRKKRKQQNNKTDASEYVLELDPLNAMPTMTSMLQAIDALYFSFRKEWKTGVMPKWMQGLKEKLEENDILQSHPNIRWFIAKIIVNKPAGIYLNLVCFFVVVVCVCVCIKMSLKP